MIVFDTEDNSAELLAAGRSGFEKEITQIAAICDNGKRFHNTGNVKEFFNFCHAMPPGNVWAFNAQYDIGNLCNDGDKFLSRTFKGDGHKKISFKDQLRLDDFDMTLVKGRFIKGKTLGLDFYDVHNLSGAGSSVKTLGKAVGLEKLDGKASNYLSKEYVFRDCEIPLKWLKFVGEKCADLGIENIPATLGGLCVKAFAAGGNENWFQATEESEIALTGARVELFSGGGRGRICYADINSLYPWAMTQKFPECFEDLGTDLSGYGIAKIDIEIPVCRIAPLPVKDENGRMIFPTGRFSGVWTLAEIRNAIKNGGKVLKLHWCYGSKTGKAYYRAYILEMYANRLKAESPAENLFWKLLMNNLYGRLAIGGEISRTLNLTDANKHGDGIPYGRKILATQNMPLPDFTNYLHAAHVLSYGRLRLFDYLRRIPADDLIYCDTDSVIFFCRGNPPFPVSKELGEMKLEAWGRRCVPYLPKQYIFDDVYKAKGVPKSKAKEFILTGRAEYDLPFKLREAINFYDAENSRRLSVWRKVEKIRAAKYDRKEINGKFFLPKTVNMI